MKTHRTEATYLPPLVWSVAMLLIGAVIAAAIAWSPGSTVADLNEPPAPLAGQADMETKTLPAPVEEGLRTRTSAWAECPECGFIVSTREIELVDDGIAAEMAGGAVLGDSREAQRAPVRRHEVTIRMNDGRIRKDPRVCRCASPELAAWRARHPHSGRGPARQLMHMS